MFALGDSITAGTSGGVTTPWPSSLGTALGSGYVVTNYGAGGSTTANMVTRWSTYRPLSSKWMTVLGGVNDISTGIAPATVISNLQSIYAQAKADGCHLIALTMTPWKNSVNWTAGRQTDTDTVNAGIISYCQANGIDYLDTYNTALNDGGGVLAAPYASADLLHPNQTGADYIETLVRAKFP